MTPEKEIELTEEEKIAYLVQLIGTQKSLRIERWRDEYRHWRVGVEWYSEDKCEFVCEKPTLLEALETVQKYLDEVTEDFENSPRADRKKDGVT